VEKFKRTILITGTPGVGKTAVSRLLASEMKARHVNLGELVKLENLITGVDKARGTLIVDTSRVSRRLKKIIEDSKQDVIVDGHYAVDVVPAKDVFMVIVLRRNPDELKRLMEDRGFGEEKLRENLAAEILDVCLYDAVEAFGLDKVCEIDVSGKEVKEVVDEVISVLEGKSKCMVGVIDWLGKLDKEGRLRNFFEAI